METHTELEEQVPRFARDDMSVSAWTVFFAFLRRDVRVAIRELPFFLVRTTMQPVLLLIVFGYLLPKMNFMNDSYKAALLPGILAVSLTISAIQSVALPMVQEFGWTREIDDRLLAPVSIQVIVAEKIVGGVLQGVIATLVVLPLARLILGSLPEVTFASTGLLLLVTILGATAFSALGMWLGTAISPQQIGLMFSVIIAPMLFFGCAYYPWKGLEVVPVLKYAVLINPMVYVAEGLRGALTPSVPHMHMGIVLTALVAITTIFWILGTRSFKRRAIG